MQKMDIKKSHLCASNSVNFKKIKRFKDYLKGIGIILKFKIW